MNTRRGFFKKLAGIVAAVAIAPEIAFRTRLELPDAGFLFLSSTIGIREQLELCGSIADCEIVKPDVAALKRLFQDCYAARAGNEHIEVLTELPNSLYDFLMRKGRDA